MVGTPFKWTAEATTAVLELKQEAQSLPPLEPIFFWPLCPLHRCLWKHLGNRLAKKGPKPRKIVSMYEWPIQENWIESLARWKENSCSYIWNRKIISIFSSCGIPFEDRLHYSAAFTKKSWYRRLNCSDVCGGNIAFLQKRMSQNQWKSGAPLKQQTKVELLQEEPIGKPPEELPIKKQKKEDLNDKILKLERHIMTNLWRSLHI